MLNKLSIYLSGSVKKGKGDEEKRGFFWGDAEIEEVRKGLAPIEVNFLNPSERSDDLRDSKSVFGRDLAQVYLSDAIIVDAREGRGVGVGAEMIFAKQHRIPVVSIVPKSSHYQRDNLEMLGQKIPSWTHPFIVCPSDFVASSPSEAANWIKDNIAQKNKKTLIKDGDYLMETMQHYLETQLPSDTPMRALIEADKALEVKKNSFLKKRTDVGFNSEASSATEHYSKNSYSFWGSPRFLVPAAFGIGVAATACAITLRK